MKYLIGFFFCFFRHYPKIHGWRATESHCRLKSKFPGFLPKLHGLKPKSINFFQNPSISSVGRRFLGLTVPISIAILVQGQSARLLNLEISSLWNSIVQVMHSIPELKSAYLKSSLSSTGDDRDPHLLADAIKELFVKLDGSSETVTPEDSLMIFLHMNLHFTQKDIGTCAEQGTLFVWLELLRQLAEPLRSHSYSEGVDIIKELFLFEFSNRVHCERCNKDDHTSGRQLYLRCQTEELNTLKEGLKHDLCFSYKDCCSCSGSEEVHWDTSMITSLPRYFTVYIKRFGLYSEQEGMKKVLGKVTLSLKLDVTDLCSEEFRQKLHLCQGLYDLVAVIAHKEVSMKTDHYAVWIKKDNGIWIQYNDNTRC